MRKALIVAITLVCILLVATIGLLIYLEYTNDDSAPADTQDAVETTLTEETQDTVATEMTEETVSITFNTEAPEEVVPGYTWPENYTIPTGSDETVDPDITEDPNQNEAPPMDF